LLSQAKENGFIPEEALGATGGSLGQSTAACGVLVCS